MSLRAVLCVPLSGNSFVSCTVTNVFEVTSHHISVSVSPSMCSQLYAGFTLRLFSLRCADMYNNKWYRSIKAGLFFVGSLQTVVGAEFVSGGQIITTCVFKAALRAARSPPLALIILRLNKDLNWSRSVRRHSSPERLQRRRAALCDAARVSDYPLMRAHVRCTPIMSVTPFPPRFAFY